MSDEYEGDADQKASPFASPLFVGAALFVAALVLGGGYLLITGDGDDSTAAPTPAPTKVSTSPAPSEARSDSICGLKANDVARPVKSGPKASWEYVGYTAFPVSKTYGPARVTKQGYRECFQKSPEGALFYAAYNLAGQLAPPAVMTKEGYRDSMREWLEFVAADGPYREDLTTVTASNFDVDPEVVSQIRTAVEGFRILMYEDDQALVDLLTSTTTNGQEKFQSTSVALVWQGGDWKVSAESAKPINVVDLVSPVGYVTWGVQTDLPIGDDE